MSDKIEKEIKEQLKTGRIFDTQEDFERPFREKVFDPQKDLRSDVWDSLKLDDLWHQRILLQDKINYCLTIGQGGMAQQMDSGLRHLDVLIQERSMEEDKKNKRPYKKS